MNTWQLKEKLALKLRAENARNLSDDELIRVFAPLVAGRRLFYISQQMRDDELLTLEDLR